MHGEPVIPNPPAEAHGPKPPCGEFEPLPDPPGPGTSSAKPGCPDSLKKMCGDLNAQFREWRVWGLEVKGTFEEFAQYIWRLEHAVCCLEGHIIYGKDKPKEGLICDEKGFRPGTFHTKIRPPYPVSDPPEEPWG